MRAIERKPSREPTRATPRKRYDAAPRLRAADNAGAAAAWVLLALLLWLLVALLPALLRDFRVIVIAWMQP